MWKSLRTSAPELVHWLWVVVVGVVAGGVLLGLSLGLGVDVPAPVWIAVSITGLLVAQLLTLRSLRGDHDRLQVQLAEETSKSEIRTHLGRFAIQGEALQVKVSDGDDPRPDEEINQWLGEVREYIETFLGNDYVARLYSGARIPLAVLPARPSEDHGVHDDLYARLARLNELIKELSD
jgi:hypothetical protein